MTPFEITCVVILILCAALICIAFADRDFCPECQMYHNDIPD